MKLQIKKLVQNWRILAALPQVNKFVLVFSSDVGAQKTKCFFMLRKWFLCHDSLGYPFYFDFGCLTDQMVGDKTISYFTGL